MSRLRLPDFSEGEPATMNADLDASILDEDAWEDATDEASVPSEMLRHSQWRSSALDTVDQAWRYAASLWSASARPAGQLDTLLGPQKMLPCIAMEFPRFAKLAPHFGPEQILPAILRAEIAALEHRLGIELPASYKQLLHCARGFWLNGGMLQFGREHPFFHAFEALDRLTQCGA